MHAKSNYIVYFNVSGQRIGKKLLEIIIFFIFLIFKIFFVIGAHLGGYHGNKFEFFSNIFFNMKHFSKYYKKFSNSISLSFIVIKH